MFVDEKQLDITAGKGGDGAALFRREIYVPKGGPDGGDGGKGGDVYLLGQRNLHALSHLAHIDKIKAENGKTGGHRRSTGKSGEDVLITVPLGTVIQVKEKDKWQENGELVTEGQRMLIAKGGNGGWGNWHFRSSVQQAPTRFNPGLPGEQKTIKLVLKLIADVGLIGLPNTGKSTFLAAVSAAHPKIADYPFTTLEPQLGVAEIRDKSSVRQWVIADLPGLIEGASKGKGLGIAFLKHIERTRNLIHFIDASQELEDNLNSYRAIRQELAGWSRNLAEKPELIALSKIDLLPDEDLRIRSKQLEEKLNKEVYPISAISKKGITGLLSALT